jgi:hypothetical protein
MERRKTPHDLLLSQAVRGLDGEKERMPSFTRETRNSGPFGSLHISSTFICRTLLMVCAALRQHARSSRNAFKEVYGHDG